MSAINEYTQSIVAVLHAEYVPLEKTAEHLLYRLSPQEADDGALGAQFTKLAADSGLDPWALAWDVASNFDQIVLNQDPKLQKTAEFYIDWMREMEKQALSFGGLKAGLKGLGAGIKGFAKKMSGGVKKLVTKTPKVTPSAPKVTQGTQVVRGGQRAVAKGAPGGTQMVQMAPKSAPRVTKGTAKATTPVGGTSSYKGPAPKPAAGAQGTVGADNWSVGVSPTAGEQTRMVAAKEMSKARISAPAQPASAAAPKSAPSKPAAKTPAKRPAKPAKPASAPEEVPGASQGTGTRRLSPQEQAAVKVEPTSEIPGRAVTKTTPDEELFAQMGGGRPAGETTQMFQRANLVDSSAPIQLEPATSRARPFYAAGGSGAAEQAAAAAAPAKPISPMWAVPALAAGVGVPAYMMSQGPTPPPGYGQY